MKVSVRFFTSLRELTGKKEETLEFSDNETVTIDRILRMLSHKYSKGFIDYVYDAKTGEVTGFLQFLINGQCAATMRGTQTKLKDNDVLAILPPVGGG